MQDDYNGLLYEVGDIKALTDGMCLLLHDPAKRERLGKQAVHDINTKFNIKAVPERYRELWEQLLKSLEVSKT